VKNKTFLRQLGLLMTALFLSVGMLAASSPPVMMKILVLAGNPNDLGYLSISSYLTQLGTPYQTVFVDNLSPDGSGNRLSGVPLTDSTTGNGLYQGIIQTDGSFNVCTSTCKSELSTADWAKLNNYALQYGVRVVVYDTYPDAQWGLLPGDSGASYSQTNPLKVTLSAAGSSVFSYLNPANPIPVGGQGTATIWAYRALPSAAANETTTPLLMAGSYTVAVTHKTADGRETLALTMDNYPGLIHSTAFSYGLINWVTKGVFLGSRRIYLNTQIDDLLLGNRLYAPTLSQCPNDPTCPTLFASGQDLRTLAAWQANLQSDPLFQSFHVTYAYNGVGTTWFPPTDPVFSAMASLNTQFRWLSHTWDHSDLDCFTRNANGACVPATLSESLSELNQNINVAPSLGITLDRTGMVTPFNGGLNNPNFMQAAAQVGIKYIVTAVDPPGANLGIVSPIVPSILQIPRRGNNLFDDVSSPQTGVYGSWPDEYNANFGPNGTQPLYSQKQTYSQILDIESQKILQNNMLTYEPYPLGYHIDNSSTYDGTHSMFSDLMDAAIAKYKKIYALPVLTIDMSDIATLLMDRASYNSSGVTGVYTPGVGVTLTTEQRATIPVTGACAQACITYGGQLQDSVSMSANSTVTLSLTPGQSASLASVSVNPTSVTGGSSSTGTVTLSSAAPEGGATINLASNNASATIPVSVIVPVGSTTASFNIATAPVTAATSAAITASYDSASKTATLAITPAASITLSSVSLSPSSVTGGGSPTGTVTLSGAAPSGGVTVTLSSNNASAATTPASVTIPAGSSTASFSVTTVSVTATTSAVITASYSGISKAATLTIAPPAATLTVSSVSVNPASVTGGSSATGTVTLSAPAPTGGLTLDLWTNGDPAFVPANITIAAGATTGTFTVTTETVSSTSQGTITAFYNGAIKTTTITVTPAATVGLSSVSVTPTSVKGGVSATGTVTLNAAAPTGGLTVQLWTNGNPAFVPSNITIAAGATTGTFSVTTLSVSSTQQGTITAFYNGVSKTTTISVTP
jgi:hypothetical protein